MSLQKKLGPFENLDALKTEIENNLVQGYEKRIEQELNEQIFSALLEQQDFEVPDIMVEAELENIVTDAEKSYSYHNVSMEDLGVTRDILKEKYRDVAVKQVKRHLLMDKIISDEKIELSDEELEKGMEGMATAVNQPLQGIKDFYKANPDNIII